MSSGFEEFCGGQFWNTSLTWGSDRRWPQFTLCFMNTVLVWVPCGWLWVTLPIYSYYLITRQRKRLSMSWLNINKTLFALLLTLLSVVEIILSAGRDAIHGNVPIVLFVSPSIKTATFLLSVFLVQAERLTGFITSAIQFTFYFLLMISQVVPFYTFILDEKLSIPRASIFYIQYGLITAEFLLHCFADRLPEEHRNISQKPISPELKASFLSQITYWWMTSLVYSGYKKPLEESDMWDLNPREKGANFIPQFEKSWKAELTKVQEKKSGNQSVKSAVTERTPLLNESPRTEEVEFKGGNQDKPRASLVKMLSKHFGSILMISFFLKMCCDLVQFLSPELLSMLITFTEDHSEPEWKGYIYTAGLSATALAQALLFQMSFFICMTMGMRVRSTIISIVYKKALTMNSESRKSSTVGEIVNLMSVDAQRVGDIVGYLYMLWSSPLIIGVALYLLYGILGDAVFAGLAVMILLIPVVMLISVKTRKLQMDQMKYKDERIKLMTEILNGIKVLKLYAWELSFQQKITDIRRKELAVLKTAAYLGSINTFIWNCAPILVTVATFATYILMSSDNQLTAKKAFVALSLFNILRFPINMLPMIVSFLVQSHVSISRLSKYLHYDDLDLDCVQHNPNSVDAITVENGCFTWDSTDNPTLKNINLSVPEGELLAVVGQVGAGKSSLISAVLGEMNKVTGKANLKGSVAYVAQQAWIQNATLQDNVLFASEKNDDKYKEVIEACALGPDLEMLPGGDLTEIGEKGINLSGGQKQRVSLARAVYNDADIYLLDDPLSAVDAHVGKHIFEKVIGAKGLLKNKTRILVTHGIHWLPMVDRIAVITKGVITEMGNYEELLSHHGPFADFIRTYLTEEQESSDGEENPELADIKVRILERMESVLSEENDSGEDIQNKIKVKRESLRRMSSRVSESSDNEQIRTHSQNKVKRTMSKDEKSVPPSEVEKLIEDEKSETGKVKLNVYVDYVRFVGVTVSCLLLLFYMLTQAAAVYSNVWLSLWTEDPELKNTSQSGTPQYRDKTYMYLGVYGGLGLVQGLMVLVYALLFASAQVKASTALHLKMLANILRSPMSFFDTTPIGRIVNRFSRDVETIDNLLPQTISTFLSCFFGVLSVLFIISFSTPIFLAVIVPLAVIYYLLQKIYIPTARQLKRLESTTRSPIYTHFSETVTGASTIRAFGVQERFMADSQQKVDRNLLFYFAGHTANRWLGFRLEFFGNIVVMVAALFAVVYRETLTGGIVGLSVSYALQVTMLLNWLVRMSSDLETNIVSVERVKEYSETPSEADWYCPSNRPYEGWPPTGVVEFRNYTTRYRPGLDLVIKGITYQVNGGEKVGIVGRTGAGKSSLTLALFRLIEAAGGSIMIDGVKISDIGLHDLRSKLTILPQDPVLFSGSLRMNMDPFNIYTDAQIWQALEHSHLKTFVDGLAAGLDYECGEGGENLSVGQRQLVCLARTLLRKTKILILDEATAAVDMETDDLIQKTISSEFKDCTVMTIAHRLNTIMDYDRVIVLESGLIREFGNPGELLQNKQGLFYGMAKDAGII